MVTTARVIGSILPIGMGVVLAWTGCAEVAGIEDWNGGAGGQGGEGQQNSAASTLSSGSVSNGSGAQVVAASSGAGTGGHGGQTSGCDGLCVGDVPAGWQGYVTATVDSKSNPLPSCDSAWPSQLDWKAGTLFGPPASCSACDCTAPMGGQCNLTQVGISLYSTQGCGTSLGTMPVSGTNCTGITIPNGGGSFWAKLVGQSLPSNSSCMADGGLASVPPAYFDKHARMCADPGIATTCSDGRQCLPQPPAGFPAVCIYQTVNDGTSVSCPLGFNPAPDFFTGIGDDRSCSACTCGPPVAQTCDMYAQIYSGAGCGTSAPPLFPGTCGGPYYVTNGAAAVYVTPGTPKNGSCNPSTPNPTGSAYGTGRTIVCCLP